MDLNGKLRSDLNLPYVTDKIGHLQVEDISLTDLCQTDGMVYNMI